MTFCTKRVVWSTLDIPEWMLFLQEIIYLASCDGENRGRGAKKVNLIACFETRKSMETMISRLK